jgi:GNAT superfamily N-acetyltransferase
MTQQAETDKARTDPTGELSIRPARESDLDTIVTLIRQLAEYERLSHEVVMEPDTLRRHLFGPNPHAEVLIAEVAGEPSGFALFFHNFSTFLGRPGIYLEDLFVLPQWRGHGHGKALLARLAQLALERDCGRLEWAVLDWNEPAIGFYRRLGARPNADWHVFRLHGEALQALAAVGPGANPEA